MTSHKFQEIAKKVAKRDKAVFDELIHYENTGSVRTKERLNFTVDKSIAKKFRRHCKEQGYNMSAKIEQAMQQIMG